MILTPGGRIGQGQLRESLHLSAAADDVPWTAEELAEAPAADQSRILITCSSLLARSSGTYMP